MSAIGGYFVIRMASFLLCGNSKAGCSQRPAKANLVLAGLQPTDALFQAPLAQRLSARYGDSFLWLIYSKQEIMRRAAVMTPEEEVVFDATGKKEAYCISSDQVPLVVWKHPIFARLADSYAYWKVAGVLSKTVQSSLSRSDWFDRMGNGAFSNTLPRYERWRRFLDAASPKVIAALSNIATMAFVRAWAHRKRVPFVLFPHGVYPSIRCQYQVDGDYLGVFGRFPAQQIQVSGISKAREVALCGPMQFGAKRSNSSTQWATSLLASVRLQIHLRTLRFRPVGIKGQQWPS